MQYCSCKECLSGNYNQENFFVDIHQKNSLKKGLSGYIRVKNESETLSACIESCFESLDELLIIVQPSSDNSLEIALDYQKKYPYKIKVYEYLPTMFDRRTTNLNIYQMSQEQKDTFIYDNTVHSVANYNNFAIRNCNYKYICKIDADQVYTKKLKFLRDCYKGNYFNVLLTLLSNFFKCLTLLSLLRMFTLIARKKHRTNFLLSLCGINLFKIDYKIYTLKEKNINYDWCPLNGGNDHSIHINHHNFHFTLNNYNLCEVLSSNENLNYNYGGLLWLHLRYIKKENNIKKLLNNNTAEQNFIAMENFITHIDNEIKSQHFDDSKYHPYYKNYLLRFWYADKIFFNKKLLKAMLNNLKLHI